MFYGKAQQSWLEIAESCRPELHHRKRYPRRAVVAERHPATFQGWQMRPDKPLRELLRQPFGEGDSVVLDFGEHLVGYLHFTAELVGRAMGGPLRLRFIFAEVPAEIGESFDPFRGSLSRAWLQDEVVTLDTLPQTRQLSRRFAFRYVKIAVTACSFDYRLALRDIYCDSVTSAPGAIETLTDERMPPRFRKIDEVALRTLRNCMQTVLEDGPKRDRRLWLADSPLMAQVIYYTFRNYQIYKRCLHLFAGLAHADGRLPACVYERPHPHRGEEFILDFAVMFAAYVLDYAQHSGDWETAERLWPVARRQVDFGLEYLDEEGRYRDLGKWWVFIDWQPGLDKQAAMPGLLLYAFEKVLQLARTLDRESEVAFLEEIIGKMGAAAREMRSPEPPGLFVSGAKRQISWASQVWMILAGVVDAPTGGEILRRVMRHPRALKPVTPFVYHYTVETLLQCGLEREAAALLKSYWGKMIAHGATTFWEVFDPDDPFSSPYQNYLLNSYCHSWSCTPAYLLRKYSFWEDSV